ncbi:hypothetical protein [uncultured Tateyamaria sp.]|uniref:hypothetical protein n=1 Tax=uncultured Tateyamaria sp. TaxID=455651 RepID=UPI002629F0A7|nr:hypothetical protein [uncultured Tateyamaria sp.]
MSRIEFDKNCLTLGRAMIGVILWSDPTTEKAVIWCEDHGDLAFLSRDDCDSLPEAFFDVGDMVEFDAFAERNLRKVRRAHLLQQNHDTTLPDSLHRIRHEKRALVDVTDSAEIIPFRLPSKARPAPERMPQQLRSV